MLTSLKTFREAWDYEGSVTEKLLFALTDASLKQKIADGHWDLGQVAWHITTVIPEMMNRTGLDLEGPDHESKPPSKASQILDEYRNASKSLLKQIEEKWTDNTLLEIVDMYGMKWTKGMTLGCLLSHQTHHRGQMTVLMRQAGLKVAGIYGPAKEEWEAMGMKAPV